MRPAWQSPSRPAVPSQSSSSSATGLALNSAHFPPPSSSLLPPERPSHGSHSAGAGVVREPKETANSLFGGGTETALDRVMNMLEGFEDDMECPLCLEEMDISDLNFKPCPCGYQICRFCYHHIKENLNKRCPACRAIYSDETVEFKAIKPDELKRLQAAKKLRDKRRKDEALTMKNMSNVRVRQRAQVHIQGMTTKIANEDTLNQLKGSDHFGQYGKVVKLFMSKRTSSVPPAPSSTPSPLSPYQPVNVYVNYRTPAEASVCIAAIDGTTTEDGHKLKAIWGTTRYCPTWLKGGRCVNENCMQAHEPGEEIEGAGPPGREDSFLYADTHAISDSEIQRSKAAAFTASKKPEATLPATASWASKNAPALPPATLVLPFNASLPPLSASIKPPVVHPPRQPSIPVSKPQTHPLPARPAAARKETRDPETRKKEREELKAQMAEARVERASKRGRGVSTPPVTESPRAASPAPQDGEEEMEELEADEQDDSSPVASSSQPSSPVEGINGHLANGHDSRPRSRSPDRQLFPELEFGEGAFSFSLNLDVKGKGRAMPPGFGGDATAGGDRAESAPAREDLQRSSRDFANLDGYRTDVDGATAALFPPSFPPPNLISQPSYLGSFDPFADTSFTSTNSNGGFGLPSPFGADDLHSETPSPPPMGEDMSRRSSRFGFARRTSSSVGQGGQGKSAADFAAAMGRLGFGTGAYGGRESPAAGGAGSGGATFAPPGIGMPHPHHRPPSSVGYNSLPPLASPSGDTTSLSAGLTRSSSGSAEPSVLWPGVNLSAQSNYSTNTLPPGVMRSLASPNASTTSSPQLSPRSLARGPYGAGAATSGPPPGVGLGANGAGVGLGGPASSPLPPGISLNRTPIPAASFPLPPPAPRPSGQASTIVGKDDLLALIAKAQAAAPKQQQHQEPHPFFSDPAILNARLASVSNGAASPALPQQQLPPQQSFYGNGQQQQQPNGMGVADHSLYGAPPQQYRPFDQQPQYGNYALPPPPGVRPPSAHYQQQQQQQQMYRNGGKA